MIIDRNAVTQEVPIDPKPANRTSIPWPPFRCRPMAWAPEVSPYVAQAVEAVIRESGLPQENQRPVHQRGRRSGRRAQGGR